MLELSSRLQKTLENQSANLQANFGREGILSKHFFCSEKGFKVGNALSLFTVNDPCQLSAGNFDMSLRPATVTHT